MIKVIKNHGKTVHAYRLGEDSEKIQQLIKEKKIMYPKFKEISLDTATWTVAFLGAIEERETKSKKPFCTFHLLDGAIAITANLWNTAQKDIYKVQEKSVISVQLYKKLYNGVETYEVKEYQAAPDDAKLEDYLLTAPIPSQDMMDEIKSILSKEISETELYPLVMEILDENADKLLTRPSVKNSTAPLERKAAVVPSGKT